MAGHRVSLGHTGATYEEAGGDRRRRASRDASLNRMSSMASRSPGVVGAVLESNAVSAEIICDGHHVHPSLVAMAIRSKSVIRMMAITDATAAAGLPVGSRAGSAIRRSSPASKTAMLENGTLAGSMLTMDGAFRMLVTRLGLSLPDAARMCATTPAEAIKAADMGAIVAGKWADLVVLDRDLRVNQTYIAGEPAVEQLPPIPSTVLRCGMKVLTLVATAVLLAGCEVNLNTEGLSARELKTFKVTGQPEVVLDTFDGCDRAAFLGRNEIEVEVEKRAMEQALLDEIKVDAQQQGDKIIIKVTGPARADRHGVTIGMHISPTARLRVAVPRNANINAMSGDGSIAPKRSREDRPARPATAASPATRSAATFRYVGRRIDQDRQRHRQARPGDRRRQHRRGSQAERAARSGPETDRSASRSSPIR